MNKPQPSDSFFSTINEFDPQVKNFRSEPSEELIEASTRRLAELKGPIYAAVRIQRIADICAGVHVMPIEHWNKKDAAPASNVPAAPVKKEPRFLLRAAALSAFGLGWLCATVFYIVMETLRLAL